MKNSKKLLFFCLSLITLAILYSFSNKINVVKAASDLWSRTGTILSPTNANDGVSVTSSTNIPLQITQTGSSNALTVNSGTGKFVIDKNGNVGIGTTAPASDLSVGGVGASNYTIYGTSSSTNIGIYGDNNSTGVGVKGTNSSSGAGVYGSSNTGPGVYGAGSAGAGGIGVEGVNSSSGIGGYFASLTGLALETGAGNVHMLGNVGIGTTNPGFKLEVAGNNNNGVTTRLFNTSTATTADGLRITLGNPSNASVPGTNHFINFETSGLGNVGSIKGNGAKGVQYATSGPADFAEYFAKDEKENIEFGSLVCIGDNANATLCNPGNNNILGVTSEKPTFVGGNDLGNKSITVALVGQVLLKVKGEIKIGDPLTFSDTPGVAVKATKNGPTVGRALGYHSGSNTDKILMVVSPSWFTPSQ